MSEWEADAAMADFENGVEAGRRVSAYEQLVEAVEARNITSSSSLAKHEWKLDRTMAHWVIDAILSAAAPCATCGGSGTVGVETQPTRDIFLVNYGPKSCPDCNGKPAIPLIVQHLLDTDAAGLVDALIQTGKLEQVGWQWRYTHQSWTAHQFVDISENPDEKGSDGMIFVPVYRLVGVEEKP